MKHLFFSKIWAFIANLFHHYDSALFGLLSPFLAPIFFPQSDPINALIYTYGMIPLGYLAKPCGAYFFGKLADRSGPYIALRRSVGYTALVTCFMGILPTYATCGFLAPVFLGLMRLIQSFCAAGQTISGAQVVLKDIKPHHHTFFSSLFDAHALGGMLLASVVIGLSSQSASSLPMWRFCFFVGIIPAILACFIKNKKPAVIEHQVPSPSLLQLIRSEASTIITLIFVSGFTHLTYQMAFTFTCGFLPKVSGVCQKELLLSNSYLLVIDMMTLPLFGYLAQKLGKQSMMQLATLLCAVLSVPLFSCLLSPNFTLMLTARIFIVLIGTAYASCYWAYTFETLQGPHRLKILSLSSSLGALLIGAPSSCVCLKLFQLTKSSFGPSLYITLLSSMTSLLLFRAQRAFKIKKLT